jgi:uncharacterized protein YqgC (DUF456 family)
VSADPFGAGGAGHRVSGSGELLVGLVIAASLVGVLLPVLPGLVLVWGAVGVWALSVHTLTAWLVLAATTALFVGGTVVKYVVPGRRLRGSGVPWSSMAAGAALGFVGFFVLPVVGLPIGFVLGVYLAELTRLGSHDRAVGSTRQAAAAAGWSVLIELGAGVAIALVWLLAVLAG